MPIDYDNPLEERLTELTASGQSAALHDLTDFTWDEVHLLRGLTKQKVEEIVGAEVIRDERYDPEINLLVFEDEQTVVKVIGVYGMLTAERPSWPREVLLEAWRGLLKLPLPGETS